jgi:hypothetical protein
VADACKSVIDWFLFIHLVLDVSAAWSTNVFFPPALAIISIYDLATIRTENTHTHLPRYFSKLLAR